MIECYNQNCKHHERHHLKEEPGPYCHTFLGHDGVVPDCPPKTKLSERVRAGAEAAPWVIEEIKKLEEVKDEIDLLRAKLKKRTIRTRLNPTEIRK